MRSRTTSRQRSPLWKRASTSARRVSRATATGNCSISTSKNPATLTRNSFARFAARTFIQTFFYLSTSDGCTNEPVRNCRASSRQLINRDLLSDETFPCPSCSKIFATKPNLDSHIKKIHQTESKKFVCETCNNSFSSAPNLKQHVKTVHEVEVSWTND